MQFVVRPTQPAHNMFYLGISSQDEHVDEEAPPEVVEEAAEAPRAAPPPTRASKFPRMRMTASEYMPIPSSAVGNQLFSSGMLALLRGGG